MTEENKRDVLAFYNDAAKTVINSFKGQKLTVEQLSALKYLRRCLDRSFEDVQEELM